MKKVNDWDIGYKHLTKDGSVLTVIDRYVIKNGSQTNTWVSVECSECSKDKELWKKGSIRGLLYNFKKGHTPCDCGGHVGSYTKEQWEIIFKREGKKLGFEFHSLSEVYSTANFTCLKCSKDLELWPLGSVTLNMESFKRKSRGCGCSKKPVYTEEQYCILIKRKLNGLPFEFVGWENNQYRKGSSRPLIKCLTSGITKPYYSISDFLISKQNKPFRLPPLKTVFFTKAGGTLKPLYFTGKKLGNNKEVAVVCSRCSKDFELFPEPFTTSPSKLQEGSFPCVCDNFKKWTDHEYRVKIERYCKEQEFTNVSIPTGINISADTYFSFTCKNGHSSKKTVDGALNFNRGCGECYGGVLGCYFERLEEKDFLYIMQFDNDYIKVGRSFEVERRYKELVQKSEATNVEILHTFTGTHSEVFTVEQYLHSTLESAGYYHHESKWTIESFHKESLQLTLGLIGYTVLEEIK